MASPAAGHLLEELRPDESRERRHLFVDAREGHGLLRIPPEDEAVAAAHADVGVAAEESDAQRLGSPPALEQFGLRPRVEDDAGRAIERARHDQLAFGLALDGGAARVLSLRRRRSCSAIQLKIDSNRPRTGLRASVSSQLTDMQLADVCPPNLASFPLQLPAPRGLASGASSSHLAGARRARRLGHVRVTRNGHAARCFKPSQRYPRSRPHAARGWDGAKSRFSSSRSRHNSGTWNRVAASQPWT